MASQASKQDYKVKTKHDHVRDVMFIFSIPAKSIKKQNRHLLVCYDNVSL